MLVTPTSFVILVVLGLLGLWVVLELGSLPGKIAAEKNHPQAGAIKTLGWLGLVFGGVGWVAAMVWANMRPVLEPIAQVPADSKPAEVGSTTEDPK